MASAAVDAASAAVEITSAAVEAASAAAAVALPEALVSEVAAAFRLDSAAAAELLDDVTSKPVCTRSAAVWTASASCGHTVEASLNAVSSGLRGIGGC